MSCVEMSHCHSPDQSIEWDDGDNSQYGWYGTERESTVQVRGAPEWMGGGCKISVLRVLDGTIQNY